MARTKALGLLIAVFAPLGLSPGEAEPASGQGATAPPVNIQLVGLYDTNVAASSPALAAVRGISPEDERFSPELTLNYTKNLGIESFYLQGVGGYDFYQRNTILNRERLQAAGGGRLQVSNCLGSASATYARRQSELEDIDLSLGTINNTEEDISGTLALSCNQSGVLVPTMSVSRSWSSNSALIRKSVDNHNLSVQGNFLYRSTLGNISLLGQYVAVTYPDRIVGSVRDGYNLYSGGLKLEPDFGPRLLFTGSVSETSLKSSEVGGVNFQGLTFDTSLSYQLSSRLTAGLDFGRHTQPSNRIGSTYAIEEVSKIHADYQLGSRVKLKIEGSQTVRGYQGAALVPGTDLTHELVRSVSGSGEYDLGPLTSVKLGIYQDHRKADVFGYGYDRMRLEITVSRTF